MESEKISEAEINNLVDRFYEKVQLDPEIGPIFNEAVQSWPAHLSLLKDFWSTVLHTEQRYKGNPLLTHLNMPLQPHHFKRWLALFAETAKQVMTADHAATVIYKSERIAENFQFAIASHRGTPTL